jgi:PKD repeat protein
VQLNGHATDSGSNDQATLQYTWTFGDGSPSATSGPNVAHAYATPGDYTATLEVCDKDLERDTDSLIVHVTKRDTTLGYAGPLLSAPSKTVTVTDSTGRASANIKLVLKPGSYTVQRNVRGGRCEVRASANTGLTFVIGNK